MDLVIMFVLIFAVPTALAISDIDPQIMSAAWLGAIVVELAFIALWVREASYAVRTFIAIFTGGQDPRSEFRAVMCTLKSIFDEVAEMDREQLRDELDVWYET